MKRPNAEILLELQEKMIKQCLLFAANEEDIMLKSELIKIALKAIEIEVHLFHMKDRV